MTWGLNLTQTPYNPVISGSSPVSKGTNFLDNLLSTRTT